MSDVENKTWDAALAGTLGAVRRRLRMRLLAEGVVWLVLILAAGAAGTFCLDYSLRLDRPLRLGLLCVWSVGVLWVLWKKLLAPLLVPMTEESLAVLLEGRFAELQGRLIGTLQLVGTAPDAGPVSGAMIGRMAEQARSITGELPVGKLVERRRLGRLAMWMVGCVLILSSGAFARADLAQLWWQRNVLLQSIDWPQDTYLSVLAVGREGELIPLFEVASNGDVLAHRDAIPVLRGGSLEIVVEVAPGTEIPDSVTLHTEYPSVGETIDVLSPCDLADRSALAMQRNKPIMTGYFRKTFASVTEAVEFFATGGDDRRDGRRPHRVQLVDPPALKSIRFAVDYPAYLRSRRLTVLDGGRGVLSLPIGTVLHIEGVANKDLASARITLDGKAGVDVSVAPDDSGRQRKVVAKYALTGSNKTRTLTMSLSLKDTQGYGNDQAGQYIIQVEPDRSPEIELQTEGVRSIIAPTARIPLRAVATDDHGVAHVTMRYQLAAPTGKSGDAEVGPLSAARAVGPASRPDGLTERSLIATQELDIEPLKLAVGTEIVITAETADHLASVLGGPNKTESVSVKLRVVPSETILGDAVSKQREARVEFFEALSQQIRLKGRMQAAARAVAKGVDVRAKLNDSEALQEAIGSEVQAVGTTLQAVARELELNVVGKPEDVADLRTRVADPLMRLTRSMKSITTKLRETREGSQADVAERLTQVIEAQSDAITQMDSILESMLKMENRVELARRLEGVLQAALELQKMLKRRAEKGTENIFD
jgi:hypothetical protein